MTITKALISLFCLLTVTFTSVAETSIEHFQQIKQEIAEGNYINFSNALETFTADAYDPATPLFLDLLYDVASKNINNVREVKAFDFLENIEQQLENSGKHELYYRIARFYRSGIVLERNPKKAFTLATQATGTLRGTDAPATVKADAYYMLGDMTLKGEGTPTDIQVAINHFNEALKCNNPQALERLQTLLDLYGNQYFNPFPRLMANFEAVGDYNRSRAAVKKYGKWTLADSQTGSEIFKARYDTLALTTTDNVPTLFKAKKPQLNWIIIDADGNELVLRSYDDVIPLYNSLSDPDPAKWQFLITKDGKKGIVVDNSPILDPDYKNFTDIVEFPFAGQNMFLAQETNKWGLYDQRGIQIVPSLYTSLIGTSNAFSDDYIIATHSEKVKTLYDKSGIKRIPHDGNSTYSDIRLIGKDCFALLKSGKWGLNNANDESIMPFVIDKISISEKLQNLFAAQFKGQWMLVDTEGRVIVHPGLIKSVKNKENQGLEIMAADGRTITLTGDFTSSDNKARHGFAPATINGKPTRIDAYLNEQQ